MRHLPNIKRSTLIAPVALLVAGAAIVLGSGLGSAEDNVAAPAKASSVKLVVSPRQDQLKNFPCSECHANIEEATKKELPATHRTKEFKHFEGIKQCDTCHNLADMDRLFLVKGDAVSFNDSPKLCGQCHSEKLRDWKTGAHGKHVGNWNGNKTRYSCADCHDPHRPGWQPMSTVAAPAFPKQGIRKGAH